MRHGIAEDPSEAKPDRERSLTAEGHARMKKNALGLANVFPRAQAIYSSPFLRAMQTALWVSKAYRSRARVETTDSLVPQVNVEELRGFLQNIPLRRAVVIGHDPSLTDVVMHLLGHEGKTGFQLKKGGCCALRFSAAGTIALEWFVSPRVLRKLAP